MNVFEEVQGNKENYEKYRKPERKVKKEREIRNKVFLGLKRKKVRKPKSELQEILDEIMAKNLKTFDEIKGFLASKYLNFENKTVNFLSDISQTKVINGKLVVSDSFANKKISYRVCSNFNDIKFITNDFLWLAMNFKSKWPDDSFSALKFDDKFKITKVNVISPPFLVDGDLNNGFIQDNTAGFFAYGLDNLTTNEIDSLFKFDSNTTVIKFSYLGKNYVSSSIKGYSVICLSDLIESARGLYGKQIYFNNDNFKKFANIKAKTIEVKNKPRFIDSSLKPEDFCPAFLKLNGSMVVRMLFELSFDYNSLFDYAIKYANNNKDVLTYPEDFVYWDNLSGVMDLFTALVLCGSTFGLGAEVIKQLRNTCEMYNQYRINFDIWGSVMMRIQKIIVEFYNSFNSRINFDRIKNMRDKFLLLYDEYKKLLKDEDKDKVQRFFYEDGYIGKWAKCLLNQMNEKYVGNLLKSILNVMTMIETNETTNVVKELEKVANVIYSATYSDKLTSKTLFPVLLSPGAFFGEGMDTSDNRDKYYKEILEKYVEVNNKKVEEVKKNDDNLVTVINQLSSLKRQVIANNINEFANKNINQINAANINLDAFKNRMNTTITNALKSNKTLSNYLTVEIFKCRDNLDNIKNIQIDETSMNNWGNLIFNNAKKEESLNAINNQINQLQDKKDQITKKKKKRNYVIQPDDKSIKTIVATSKPNNVGQSITLKGNKPANRNIISQYYTNLVSASGAYEDFINSNNQLELMAQEDPVTLAIAFPLANQIIDKVRMQFELPTLDQVLEEGATMEADEKSIGDEAITNKILNAYILANSMTGDGDVDIEKESSFDINKINVTDPTIQNVAKNFLLQKGQIIKNLNSYKKGFLFEPELQENTDVNSNDNLMIEG